MLEESSVIMNLCNSYVHDMLSLHEKNVYESCQMLLTASDLRLLTVRIQKQLEKLSITEPKVDIQAEDILQGIIRQLVFTKFDIHLTSRRAFLDYWINSKAYKGKDVVTVSALINLAIENQELLTSEMREYVLSWHHNHPEIRSDRVNTWSVYCMNRAGYVTEARARADKLLSLRQSNGSWSEDLRKTVACAYPLLLSGVVKSNEIEETVRYVFKRLKRGFIYDAATRATVLKLFYRSGHIPDAVHSIITASLLNEGSIFLSHTHADKPFVRRLANDLKKHEFRVWVDEAQTLVGDSLIQKVESGIADMQYLGVVLSPRSVKSAWVRIELDMALITALGERKIKVLPLLIEDCEIPLALRALKYADFRTDYEFGFKELVRRLRPE